MKVNQHEIVVKPKPKRHPGFWDSEGQELNPGDHIAVNVTQGWVGTAIITRFTARRVYYIMCFIPPYWEKYRRTEDKFPHEWCNQLPRDPNNFRVHKTGYEGQQFPSIIKLG